MITFSNLSAVSWLIRQRKARTINELSIWALRKVSISSSDNIYIVSICNV